MIPQTQKSCSKMKLKGSSIFVCYYQIYIVQTNTYAFVFHFAFIYLFAFFIVLFTCKLDISIQKYRTESAKFCATILTLHEKCPYSELFWHVFSHIRTEYGEIQVSLRIQSECGKIRTRITANTDTFYAVLPILVIIFKTDFFNQFF